MIPDIEIQRLIMDVKPLSYKVVNSIKLKAREDRRHLFWDNKIHSESGITFVLKIRQNTSNKDDFAVMLFYEDDGGNLYTLKRYDGIHTHPNKIEKTKIRGFHIHTATERYQEKGYDIAGYAEATDAYSDWRGALNMIIKDCNFDIGNSRLETFE